MAYKLSPMKAQHLEGVLAIENISFPTPWSRTAFAHELLHNDFAYYIVALEGKQVIGYAGMWRILDEGHITTLAVHPDYRRRKIGAGLLKELLREGVRRGCARMTLEVRPSNIAAQELYTKMGFVSHGRRPGYYSDTKEDAIIMWKDDLQ
ncbi:ribosomal-protein-alanine N-acetyltransferase [bacterium]|nr:MAG: ribosomal-protein-alanine N-acetyltransferase [bacterium]